LQDFGFGKPIQITPKEWVTYDAFFAVFRVWRSARKEAQTALKAAQAENLDVELLPETRAERRQRAQRAGEIVRRQLTQKKHH